MWITITLLLLASLVWALFVRHLARARSKATETSLRNLNASLELEVQTLSRLDKSLADWTAAMELAGRKLQERGKRPSPAPVNNAANRGLAEHPSGLDKPTRIRQGIRRDLDEVSGKSWMLIRLTRRWERENLYAELKTRIVRIYLSGYTSRNPEHPIAFHYQDLAPALSMRGVRLMNTAHHYVMDDAASYDSGSYIVKFRAMDLEVVGPAPKASIGTSDMDWVMAIERNALRMHSTVETGKRSE